MKEKLLAKLNNFLELKQNIENEAFDVEAEVQAYRESLLAKLEEVRNKKLEKIDAYIELLETLIAEEKEEEENVEVIDETEDSVEDDVEDSVEEDSTEEINQEEI